MTLASILIIALSWKPSGTHALRLADFLLTETVETSGCEIGRRPSAASNIYVTPQAYGAKGDGVTDDTASFRLALKIANVLVPHGEYLINRNIEIPSYRKVQCEPNANLHTTRHDAKESGVITFNTVVRSSVIGCTLTGSNISSVPVLDHNQWNYLIWIKGPSHNIVVSGNTLKYAWANSALHIDGNEGSPNLPSTNIVVTHNIFESNGYYGVAVISGNHISVLHNRFVDSSCCAEANDVRTDQNMYNVYAYNYLTSVNGNAAGCTECDPGIFLTGGDSPKNFNYGTVDVHDNYITGSNTRLIKASGSGSIPARYWKNECVDGCIGQ
jgi:Pectate lyase superfamily protein